MKEKLRGLQDAIADTTAQIDALDALAASVVQRVNDLHTSGTDLDGNAGTNFFNNTPSPVTAANISINAAIIAKSASRRRLAARAARTNRHDCRSRSPIC